MTTDSSADLFMESVGKKASKLTFVEDPVLPRKRRNPNYKTMNNYFGVDRNTKGAEPHHPKTVQEHYRQIYFEILDVTINSINDRFNQSSFKVFQAFENLLLDAINQNQNDDITREAVLERYRDEVDLEMVSIEANILRTVLGDEKVICFNNIYKNVKACSASSRDLVPNIVHVVRLLLINPATSCTPE